jgi:hypothetical protein
MVRCKNAGGHPLRSPFFRWNSPDFKIRARRGIAVRGNCSGEGVWRRENFVARICTENIPGDGGCPRRAAGLCPASLAAFFTPHSARICRFKPNFQAKPAGTAALVSGCGENILNLRLQDDPSGAPLPQSLFVGVQSQGKKAGFAVSRGG